MPFLEWHLKEFSRNYFPRADANDGIEFHIFSIKVRATSKSSIELFKEAPERLSESYPDWKYQFPYINTHLSINISMRNEMYILLDK